MAPRVASIMTGLDKIKEVAEQQREEAKEAWRESIKLILTDGTESLNALLIHADELRRVYILAQARAEGMAIMWAAATEIYNVTKVEEP